MKNYTGGNASHKKGVQSLAGQPGQMGNANTTIGTASSNKGDGMRHTSMTPDRHSNSN